MRFLRDPAQRRYYVPVVLCLALTALLLLLPTGYEGAVQYQEADRCAARVLAVDDSTIVDTGLVRSGEQRCTLELLGGRFQGRTATGINMLNGSLEQDKLFAPGDKAMVVVSYQGDEILSVTMTDHYRIGKEALLAAVFAVFLILFAGRTGVRAIVSFVLTVLMLWKVLVPLYLKGWNPILVGLARHSGPHPADHRPGLRLRAAVRRRRVGCVPGHTGHMCAGHCCLPTCFRSTGPLCPTRRVCSTPGIRIST